MAVGRHGCVRDVLIDWAGIGLGLLTLYLWGKYSDRSRSRLANS